MSRRQRIDIQEILVPLDGSGTAEWALTPAHAIAEAAGARIRLVRCLTTLARAFPDVTAAGYLDEWEERQQAREAEYIGRMAGRLQEAGVDAVAETVSGDAARGVVNAAAQADLVVMTAHGWSGPERAWLGHVTDAVVHHMRRPVLIVRAGDAGPPEPLLDGRATMTRVLVATDGSDAAQAAERYAAALAALLEARLTLFRAVQAPAGPSSPYIPHAAILDREAAGDREEEARRYLERRAAELGDVEAEVRTEATYHVAREILEAATDVGADLVAVGTHRDSRLARIVLGSVADKVVRGVRVPVLVAHAERE